MDLWLLIFPEQDGSHKVRYIGYYTLKWECIHTPPTLIISMWLNKYCSESFEVSVGLAQDQCAVINCRKSCLTNTTDLIWPIIMYMKTGVRSFWVLKWFTIKSQYFDAEFLKAYSMVQNVQQSSTKLKYLKSAENCSKFLCVSGLGFYNPLSVAVVRP